MRDKAEGRLGLSGGRSRKRKRKSARPLPLSAALSARSLPFSVILPWRPPLPPPLKPHHLPTGSPRPHSFFLLLVALAPFHTLFTSFCLAAIYLEMIASPRTTAPQTRALITLSPSVHPLLCSLLLLLYIILKNVCSKNAFLWD